MAVLRRRSIYCFVCVCDAHPFRLSVPPQANARPKVTFERSIRHLLKCQVPGWHSDESIGDFNFQTCQVRITHLQFMIYITPSHSAGCSCPPVQHQAGQ